MLNLPINSSLNSLYKLTIKFLKNAAGTVISQESEKVKIHYVTIAINEL